ncbi:MAG: mannose-phosphate guanylyltransferase/mannose-6-phosphate isomerase [Alphaproteobacteria bacterium]|nr:mannose-phosphate guanylyltransferase/mannose-6-phosphate isomerase [Alphaproteobacteria bacterium]
MTDNTMPAYKPGERDTRPWGEWEVLDLGTENNEEFCIKRIIVTPGGVLSLQSHKLRREEWTVLEGVLEVTRNDEILSLNPGETVHIPQGAVHRMANRGTVNAVVKEIQRGVCREDDIERFEDIYGRDVS